MIKFLALEIYNFLSVKEAIVDLNNQGLVLIEGVNKDDPSAASNGAGKSSIVDAISWCLYGETARGASGDSVINIKAGKDCQVFLKVEIDGELWLIERGRKHHKLKNRVTIHRFDDMDGTYSDKTLGTDKLTQEKINALMGCTPDIFNASIYMGQEAMPDLPGMTDKALKAIIEQALSLDKLDDALEVCKDRYATALHTATKAYNDLTKLEDDLKRDEDALNGLMIRRAVLAKEFGDITDLIRKQRIDHKRAMRDYDAERAVLVQKASKVPMLDAVAINGAAQDAFDAVEATAKPIIEKLERARQKRGEAMYEYKGLTGLLRTTEINCPTCKRPHDHAEDAERILEETKDKMNQLAGDIEKLDKAIAKLEADVIAKGQEAADARKQALEKSQLTMYARQQADLAILDLDRKWADTDVSYQVDIKANEKIREAKTLQLKDLSREEAALHNAIKVMDSDIKTAEANRDAANAKLEVLDKVKHIMGRKGFRGEVLDQITPYLNARTAYYLAQMTDENITAVWNTITTNSNGDYVENFHIAIQHKSGVNKFANLSGGEKRKVRLACAMAMQDLIGTRAVKPIKLFVADEIDDAIDEAGLELLMGVLEQKAKEVGTVLIISHNDIGDWVRNKITVVKENGQSTFKTP